MNNTIQMYDAQAGSIKVKDIANNVNNRTMLERMRRNNSKDRTSLYIINDHDGEGDEGEYCVDYVPEGRNDMGWLGYFVGKNENLTNLNIRTFNPTSGTSVGDVLEPFFSGVSNNKSITRLDIYETDLLGGRMFTMLCPFFENTQTLSEITIRESNLGDDGWRLLALAIGSSKYKSLKTVVLSNNNISDEALVDIITSLSMHPHLVNLDLLVNRLSTKGCMALATLLRCSCTELQTLHLENNEISDEGIDDKGIDYKHLI